MREGGFVKHFAMEIRRIMWYTDKRNRYFADDGREGEMA